MAQKKLSIVFITNNYTPYQGGIVSSITQHMNFLQSNGHRVTLITLDFVKNQHKEHNVIRLKCPFRFMYKNNPMALPWFPRYYLHKILKQLKPDIIHAHHPFLLGTAALQEAKNLNIPLIFTYHTLYDHYLHYIPFPQTITRPFVNYLVRSFCSNVDGIIAPSAAIKERIKEHTTTKTEIIPSAIAPLFFIKQENKLKKKQLFLQLLTVSRFTKEKNLPFLLDVFSLLKNSRFQFILAGYGYEYNALKNYAYDTKKLSTHQVLFIEKPSKQLLLELYKNAQLFLFSSTSDTQGLVLAEAMASGTPVIALDGPGQRDIIKDGFNGFIVNNKHEMKEKIEEVIFNKQLYTSLQSNAYETAQRFSPEHVKNQILDFYSDILKE
jgi:1,2-diacylglycerol 3-alpha-glucosyltransferase